MKNNWKEKVYTMFFEDEAIHTDWVDFIESLLAEQKKELIEEILTMIPEHQKPITSKRYSEIVKNNPHTPKIEFFLGENIGRNGFRQSMYILLRKYAEDNGISLKHYD